MKGAILKSSANFSEFFGGDLPWTKDPWLLQEDAYCEDDVQMGKFPSLSNIAQDLYSGLPSDVLYPLNF